MLHLTVQNSVADCQFISYVYDLLYKLFLEFGYTTPFP